MKFVNMIAHHAERLMPPPFVLAAAALWLLAALLRVWVPDFEKLPSDYSTEIRYAATLWTRQTPGAPGEKSKSTVRRRDQTLSGDDTHLIIQSDAHWLSTDGAVIFEIFNLYGVDRHTRQNLVGYGNQDRSGQYLFPPHTRQQLYGWWDSNYDGPGVVRFERVEHYRGIDVYVFNSRFEDIDETEGYAAHPEVPEKYRVRTQGAGRLWVEPLSGVVVDHEDSGVSYFIDPHSGQRVGRAINQWQERYTPETVLAQLRHAIALRRRMLALEIGLPLALLVAGLICFGLALRARRRETP